MRLRAQPGERVTLHDLRATPAYGKGVGHGLLDLFIGRTGLARRLDVIVYAGLGTPGADVDATVENGLVQTVDEGTPKGGPLSPLLSDLVLDELDKELTRPLDHAPLSAW